MVNPKHWREAVKEAGGPEAVADKLGIKRRTLFVWRKHGIPGDRVPDVSRVTGIPAAELRPDLAAAFAPQAAE